MTSPPADRRAIARVAVLGAVLAVGAVWVDVEVRGNGNPVSLLEPGADGPSAEVIRTDFPELRLPAGLGHDGQQFYAVARDPFPLDRSAPYLDRPRYRLQRPLFPVLAWALHPTGGGVGLVIALLTVNAVAVAIGVAAISRIVARAGGPVWSGLTFAALPGTFAAMRITTADVLALSLGLAAVAALDARRRWIAPALGALAVLAREPTILLLAGVAAGRRDRPSVLTTIVAGLAAAAWALYVRASVEVDERQVMEFVAPLTGWWRSVAGWLDGEEVLAAASAVLALGLGTVALVRRWRSDWTPVILLQAGFLTVLGKSVVGLNYNGMRTTMPLLAASAIALLCPGDRRGAPPPRSPRRERLNRFVRSRAGPGRVPPESTGPVEGRAAARTGR